MFQINPFITNGYAGAKYFCDREEETRLLTRHLTNQCNVALISPRRLGKSGLIRHCFAQTEISENYDTIFVDIYETKNLSEFVYTFGKAVFDILKSRGAKACETLLSILRSLNHRLMLDSNGSPVWTISIGEIKRPEITLDEIFEYLSTSDRRCLVAIDEFQSILNYPEKNIEAMLRTRIQMCNNAHFVFSGSKRHMMTEMFITPSHPFYQSAAVMGLDAIDEGKYYAFASHHFATNAQAISTEAFHYLYDKFDGITWFIQYTLNILYTTPTSNVEFTIPDIDEAIHLILNQQDYAYKMLMYQLPAKQKMVLLAIATEGKVEKVMSRDFLNKYNLTASMVQAVLKVLLDRDFITCENGNYELYDKFLEAWLNR